MPQGLRVRVSSCPPKNMKVKINSKKNLKASLSILVDKKTIEKKMDDKLIELKDKVQLKGFRPGKVPPQVIKNQFGKAVYGEVIDNLLKETSSKALEENKIKVAGQPKIDLKSFGEGKDLDYTIEVDILPDFKIKPLEKITATSYEIEVEKELVEKRLKEIAKNQQNFSEKKDEELSQKEDLIIFDYVAKVDGKDFEGNTGKNIQLVLGKDLFIKGFDQQLIGVKINQNKSVTVKLPENYPKKIWQIKKQILIVKF
ncbi:trigger factor [Pelagibacteraceae bacterium]|nr:trigger factor [Pelagibacteraceae bacterium]